METIKMSLKAIAVFLTISLLSQSCVAYHTTSSLEKASEQQRRTKVTKSDGHRFKYKYISYQDGAFYGMSKKSGEWTKTPLDQKEIAIVKTENKAATIIGTSILSAIVLYGLAIVIYVYD